MTLFTNAQFEQLLANGRNRDQDHPPVVKLFTPDAGCTWLLSEIDPEETLKELVARVEGDTLGGVLQVDLDV